MENYNYHRLTGEFTNMTIAEERPREPGVYPCPAYSTPNAPFPASAGHAVVFREADGGVPSDYQLGEWVEVIDRRGLYWQTTDAVPVQFDELGVEPSERSLTDKEPVGAVKWSGSDWVVDAEKLTLQALARRNGYMAQASGPIATLSDAVELDMATDEEIALLKAWKLYRIALSRIEKQSGFPVDIEWPTSPIDDTSAPAN
ncbi:hypothetical protein DXT88_22050 [Herbaspirillum lusitanum]|uniref:tail fiber assembly protein n=1 Tax=Herbaspirillum lusitanum TaxID=213312 RepID=UPI002237C726|nr:tail fiber assembly protein [Herbaspirillum lusitanum]MCW5300858.1 hypothetical protein [Herbaspirillum lusitanum]